MKDAWDDDGPSGSIFLYGPILNPNLAPSMFTWSSTSLSHSGSVVIFFFFQRIVWYRSINVISSGVTLYFKIYSKNNIVYSVKQYFGRLYTRSACLWSVFGHRGTWPVKWKWSCGTPCMHSQLCLYYYYVSASMFREACVVLFLCHYYY